jgi:hypothetical protein
MSEPDTMSWLAISIALSVVLTVLLNVGLRAFPRASGRVARQVSERTWPTAGEPLASDRRVRVWVPWKAMIVGSLMLTIMVNLVLWIARG